MTSCLRSFITKCIYTVCCMSCPNIQGHFGKTYFVDIPRLQQCKSRQLQINLTLTMAPRTHCYASIYETSLQRMSASTLLMFYA